MCEQVMDEPLYASYLKITGATRPYRDLVLSAQENDAHKVAAQILAPRSKPVLYAKHISKHKVGLDQSLWQGAQHMVGHGHSTVFEGLVELMACWLSSRVFTLSCCELRTHPSAHVVRSHQTPLSISNSHFFGG